ncbi:hypothetical protein HPB47_006461, partial [Ixodes persulcatus]
EFVDLSHHFAMDLPVCSIARPAYLDTAVSTPASAVTNPRLLRRLHLDPSASLGLLRHPSLYSGESYSDPH